ncbi:SSL1 General transcription and DNA repair factor IIH subunit SSL1 [Candida maltosa Xu316]|uniref:General transcription and DNA repair factor IIH n=1 Tax=Candida maltosa (strain Xu316) TaxID=1245528 RepID=M3K6W4_CANMX|nr:Suppressor of stem-loop protein 1 [Candida maltosa Xu316]
MDDSDEEYLGSNSPSSKLSSAVPESTASPRDKHGVSARTRSSRRGEISDLKGANGYAWEDELQRSWDIVKDNEQGGNSFEAMVQSIIESRKKKIMKNPTTPFQRGIIRTVVIIIDGSSAMGEKDLRPTRLSLTLNYLSDFIVEFFDQNPISRLGIILMRNGVANLVSEVSGSPQYHIDKIRQLKARQHNRFEPKGDPSLQNSLEMARSLLKFNFGTASNNSKNSKEVLIVFGALFTSDPGDIHRTIDNLIKDEIKVSVIGLSAQVAICQELVNRTNNEPRNSQSKHYGVIMNESHFKELLMETVTPLPLTESEKQVQHEAGDGVPVLRMGFPTKVQPTLTSTVGGTDLIIEFPHLNASFPTQGSEESKDAVQIQNSKAVTTSSLVGYQCPQCKSKVSNLPTICPVCGLMLILSTHLARSYHHLVPLAPYKEVPVGPIYDSDYCFGCRLKFPEGVKLGTHKGSLESMTSSRYRCPKCKQEFCINCDVFVHEVLHNCPGCENL